MGKIMNMTYASSLTNLCEINSSFDTGVLRICYTGLNRNNTHISKSVIKKSIKTLYNCPVVCNYDRESNSIGGHDMEVVRDADGGLRIVNVTTPVGVIAESSNVWFEEFEEEDGSVHEYLCADVLLWKRQEAYKKIRDDGITAHSMEITVKGGESNDGVYYIKDFEFTAFCLLGNVAPCFEGSALEVFSQQNFKQQLSEMMQDLKETFTLVNTSSEDDNTHPKFSTEGGEGALDKNELIAKYGIDISTLDFSIDDMTYEELEAKFAEMTAEPEEPVVEEPAEPEQLAEPEQYALVSNVVNEIQTALSAEKIQCEWGERSHYIFADCDLDACAVYCWDACDWLLYGFTYTMNGDNVVIDYESRKRVKYVIADFDEGEQESPFAVAFELATQKINEVKEAVANFETTCNEMTESIAKMTEELDFLRQFKQDAENAEAESKRNEIFAAFEDLSGVEAFEALREACSKYDLEELEEKCFAIRGRVGSVAKFSLEKKVPKIKVEKTIDPNEPYGGLFTEYSAESSN